MKNLPEEEMFNELENRLRQYSEKPDDGLWEKISSEVTPAKEPVWIARTNRAATVAGIALFLLLIYVDPGKETSSLSVESTVPATRERVSGTEGAQTDKVVVDETKPVEQSAALHIASEKSTAASGSRGAADNNGRAGGKTIRGEKNKEDDNLANNAPLVAASSNNETQKKENEIISDSKPSEDVSVISANEGSERRKATNENIVANVANVADSAATESFESKELAEALPALQTKTAEEKKKRKRPVYYLSALPSLSYHTLVPGKNDEIVIQKINSASILSPQRIGIALEGGIQYPLTRKIDVFGGVFVYYQRQTLRYSFQSDGEVILEPTEGGYTVTPLLTQRSVDYRMLNAGVQAGMLYTLKAGLLSHKIGAGVSYQHGLLKKSGDQTYVNSQSGYISYQVFYRNEYTINKSAHFYIQPTFSNTFWSDEKLNEPFTLKSYRAGISVGLIFTLK